ncbi:MAG: flagellar basal body P-ring protein FlgI [Pseudomonadota bacterium]
MKKIGKQLKIISLTVCLCLSIAVSAYGIRIKDISKIKGIRSNQLIGYGLVVGLNGTGDKDTTYFTVQSLVNMIEQMGVQVDRDSVTVKNVAAVIVTAKMPPFARIGNKIDIVISSIGDAKSLLGGTLLLTPLRGVDKQVYALSQGPLCVGGFSTGGAAGGGVIKNHPTVASIPRGATIEKEIPISIQNKDELTITLNNPDFTTAMRMAKVINGKFKTELALPVDSGTLKLTIPAPLKNNLVQMIASLENLEVRPDAVARVILNEKTGTIVIGEKVKISTVAIAHGNLQITIKESANVYQPAPFAPAPPIGAETAQTNIEGGGVITAPGGQTVIIPESDVVAEEEKRNLIILPAGTTIGELVRALNAIGATPRDLITILQSIRFAGALQAEIEII